MPDKYERFVTDRRTSDDEERRARSLLTEDGVVGTDYDVPLSYNHGELQAAQRRAEAARGNKNAGLNYRTWPGSRLDLSNPNSNPYHQELRWWDAEVRQDVEDGVVNVETWGR